MYETFLKTRLFNECVRIAPRAMGRTMLSITLLDNTEIRRQTQVQDVDDLLYTLTGVGQDTWLDVAMANGIKP